MQQVFNFQGLISPCRVEQEYKSLKNVKIALNYDSCSC